MSARLQGSQSAIAAVVGENVANDDNDDDDITTWCAAQRFLPCVALERYRLFIYIYLYWQ